MPSFEYALELEVSAVAMWAALKDQHTIFPKLMPEAIASMEIVDGEGGPGSSRVVKFGPSKLFYITCIHAVYTIFASATLVLAEPSKV